MRNKRESLKCDEAKLNYDKLEAMGGIGIDTVYPWKNMARIYFGKDFINVDVSLVDSPDNKPTWASSRLHFFEDYVIECIFNRGIERGRAQLKSELKTLIGIED